MTGKDLLLALATGVCLFVALSLLINPDITGARAVWGTFYGAF